MICDKTLLLYSICDKYEIEDLKLRIEVKFE